MIQCIFCKNMKNEFLTQINTYLPNVDYCSFRFVNKYSNVLSVTRNVLEPIEIIEDEGLMVTVIHNGGFGYSATSNLTKEGILKATNEAKSWSEFTKGKLIHQPIPPQESIDNGQ